MRLDRSSGAGVSPAMLGGLRSFSASNAPQTDLARGNGLGYLTEQ
jgi:hypothetical protein